MALDVLRGIAILGTLGTNIWILTNPASMVGYLDRLHQPATNAWMWTERILQQLVQGKYLGLLAIMFGIGLAIQHRSTQRNGGRWPGTYPVRAALLLLDGVLNFLLIAEFDVLIGYAVTGLIVAYLLATVLWLGIRPGRAFRSTRTGPVHRRDVSDRHHCDRRIRTSVVASLRPRTGRMGVELQLPPPHRERTDQLIPLTAPGDSIRPRARSEPAVFQVAPSWPTRLDAQPGR